MWGAEPVPVLNDFLMPGKGVLRVLDAGAGEGRNLPLLLQHSPGQVVCCDTSVSGLSKIKARFGGRVDITLCDLAQLPYTDRSFDAVLLWDVLTTLPDPLPALTEIWRVLDRGGRLVCNISDCTETIKVEKAGMTDRDTGLYRGRYFFRFLDKADGTQLLLDQGFQVEYCAKCLWHEHGHPNYRAEEHDHVSNVFSALKP